jgi:type II secretory pathway pseudopilin PulG
MKLTVDSLQFTDSRGGKAAARRSYYLSPITYALRSRRGVTLIDSIVGVAILAIVFVGFLGVLMLGTRLATDNKAHTGALSLALERMEFMRSLAYADIGSLDGGDQNNGHGNEENGYDEGNPGHSEGLGANYELFSTYYETIYLNDIEYIRRTMIAFIDDEADGTSGHDDDHETDDYKVIRVSVSWEGHNGSRAVVLVSNAAPPSL